MAKIDRMSNRPVRISDILTDLILFLGKTGITLLLGLSLLLISSILLLHFLSAIQKPLISINELEEKQKPEYWFLLLRKSQAELLYFGVPGSISKSEIVKIFTVKTGVPDKKPTPLPKLLGRQYWLITAEKEVFGSPETAPYFLSLDIPVSDQPPYGPTPYPECFGSCNWEVPGEFGLHGVGGDMSKLSIADPGSSGCIRHKDEDIAYLFDLLDPQNGAIRYYIEEI